MVNANLFAGLRLRALKIEVSKTRVWSNYCLVCALGSDNIYPLFKLNLAQKAALVTILAIIAEVLFWLGILIVGKEAATKYRKNLNILSLWRQLKKWRR